MLQRSGLSWMVSVLSAGLRRWRLLVGAAVLLALFGAVYYVAQPPKSAATVTIARGDIQAAVTANAKVRAQRSARLSFPVGGHLAEVLVHEGDEVKAGQALAKLQLDDFDRRLEQAKIALAARQLDLQKAQAAPRREDLDIMQANLKKAALALAAAEANYKSSPNNSNQVARDLAQADYDIARANFDRLTRGPSPEELQPYQDAVAAAKLDLAAAQEARDEAQLKAPYDGIVTDVTAAPGEMVGGYAPVIALADLSKLELLADVDEIDVGQVAAGQAVEIRFDAFPGQVITGTMTNVFPAASTDRGASIYHARIQFDAGDLAVRPGMGATVKIAAVDKKNVLLVPVQAVKDAGTQKVVSAIIDGVLRNVVVQTGLSDGKQTEILSGLKEGASVVIQ